MIISFFEEFPTPENMSKLKLITWPSKIYLAASSAQEFERLTKSIKNKNVQEIIYWPILKKKEGYWISPFSQQKALQRIFQELTGKNIPVMLDLELPTTQNPLLYLTQLIHFVSNKRMIRQFIESYKGRIYLAEYSIPGQKGMRFLQRWGLHYDSLKTKIIKMMYHSLHQISDEKIEQEFAIAQRIFGRNLIIGLGTIAVGITGNEPVLAVKALELDLQLAQKMGIQEVIIFRLGGLSKEYVKMIKDF